MTSSDVVSDQRQLRVGACLSLSGKYARFGTQAAHGLESWRSLDGAAELVVEDDKSDPGTLRNALRRIAAECDVLLGPYSTQLTRTAGQMAAEAGWLLWNQGGSGDDVEVAYPGHVVSMLTPTSRYAEPFLRRLEEDRSTVRLWIAHGKGSFGKQVAAGAETLARRLGIEAIRLGSGTGLPTVDRLSQWDLFSAGSFEEDVEMVMRAQVLANPPRMMCAVAAGVREFGEIVVDADGIFGVGQWFPGVARAPDLGPNETDFLAAYSALSGGVVPDYPAVQAAAGAVLAAHCARQATVITRERLWLAARALDVRTLFGDFKINSDGAQVKHVGVLIRWSGGRPVLA